MFVCVYHEAWFLVAVGVYDSTDAVVEREVELEV